jgi:Na+/H+ antiporter NhaD/arsenite permease-like protein
VTRAAFLKTLAFAAALATAGPSWAADLNGAGMSALWAIPFAAVLLCIAICPLVMPQIWHHHYGKIGAAWAAAFLLPFALIYGAGAAAAGVVHALFAEYIPFIILLTTLFTVAGGIYFRGNLHGSPALNSAIMAIGAVLASFVGTTGAAMLLIRPLIRANDNRSSCAHAVVFFIFIVANAGGSLTPLGDPPLFLGFLKGVDFFWTVKTLFPETIFMVVSLIAIFFVIDSHFYKKEGITKADPTPDSERFGIEGNINWALMLCVMGLVLMSGTWKPGVAFNLLGTDVGWAQVVRDVGLLVVLALSLKLTPTGPREKNEFSWEPMKEVAKLFIAIFLTIIPVLAMLKAGKDGAFSGIVSLVSTPDGQPIPAMYFWITGALSSFLDNAPTYLVFFNLAGGDAQVLMNQLAPTLAAISAGAVFMGANTYIGNAPNLMVKAVAESRGVKMPSFFGYMGWSICVLIPLFVVMTFIWFR